MHRGLPWADAVSAELVSGGSTDGRDLRQLVLYMHAMMMQHLAFMQ